MNGYNIGLDDAIIDIVLECIDAHSLLTDAKVSREKLRLRMQHTFCNLRCHSVAEFHILGKGHFVGKTHGKNG